MNTRVHNMDLVRMMCAHTAVRGVEHRPLRLEVYRTLAARLEEGERVLAYADRIPEAEEPLLDILLATSERFIRAVAVPASGGAFPWERRAVEVRLVQTRRDFFGRPRVDVFIPYDHVVRTYSPPCHFPEIRIWLPPALRRHEFEEWWEWDSPQACSTAGTSLGTRRRGRVEIWKRASAELAA